MLLKIINQKIRHGSNAALRFGCVGLVKGGLAAQGYSVLLCSCHLQGETHTGYSAADYQKIVFMCHFVGLYAWYNE